VIPKRIIQTWKTKKLPWRYRGYHRRLKQLHPDYEFLLFTDDEVYELVSHEYPQYADVFFSMPDMISKLDLFRLLAVHKLGGFYFDLDIYPVKPVDELCNLECVFPFETQARPHFSALYGAVEALGQYAFGGRSGHPFLLSCAENIKRAFLDPDYACLPTKRAVASMPIFYGDIANLERVMRVLYSTGPLMVTRTFLESTDSTRDVTILSAYDERTSMKILFCFGPYGVHQMSQTWTSDHGIIWRVVTGLMVQRKSRILKNHARLDCSSDLVIEKRYMPGDGCSSG
jgi:hypothetical protein